MFTAATVTLYYIAGTARFKVKSWDEKAAKAADVGAGNLAQPQGLWQRTDYFNSGDYYKYEHSNSRPR